MPDDLALSVRCPMCGQDPGDPCVYISAPRGRVLTAKGRALLERLGTPTKVPHNERRNAYTQKGLREARRFLPQPPHVAWPALRQFDLDEYYAMRNWLRRNGSIFWRC